MAILSETRVGGTIPPPDPEAGIGLPQSMQNFDARSFSLPQKVQRVTAGQVGEIGSGQYDDKGRSVGSARALARG